ncbi:MAG: TonB-dependent receptor [Dysgonamonadaceae bacterium]|jgi:TonB-linked SusC/RagA family outer membrane protein|nr:TonB-dependent receptor [Dysgonamonadaceae bacterium]
MKALKICMLLLLISLNAIAQQNAVLKMEGKVYDEENSPAIGASVYLKNRPGIGTSTGLDGTFKLDAQRNDVIVVSYIGYENFEYLVTKEEKNLEIRLKINAQQMEEVVVTALGNQQRKLSVVGAISTINTDELQVPATSLSNIIGGRLPGVITMQTSGEPGKNISEFWIRGIGTFGANSSALVLIDGLEGDLNSIDPADIESFSILKDASATAVYGVRGANGVVLITTKRGLEDRLQITARANFTVSSLHNKMPEYLGAYDYALLANEAREVRGDNPLFNDMELYLIQNHLDADLYPDINWQKEVLRETSLQQTYYVSARGGGQIARYFLSLGTSVENAAYKQDKSSIYSNRVGYNTYNYRANLDINLTKTTKVYFGADGYLSIKDEPGMADTDYIWNAQSMLTPITVPKMYSSGHFPAYGPNDAYSPYVMLNYTGMSKKEELKSMITLAIDQDLSVITNGLKLKIQGAYDNNSNFYEARFVLPEMYAAIGRTPVGDLILSKRVNRQAARYTFGLTRYRKYHFESNLNYEKVLNDHRFSGLLYYYMSDQQNTMDFDGSSMGAIPLRYQGVSSRLTYGFRDTYMIDFNFGYTGSENFEPGKQFGFFPSVAVGWIPTGYEFLTNTLPWLNFLKFRASYGSVGNDRITSKRFPYLTIVSENASGAWGGIASGITEQYVGADNLVWEKAIKSDLGIEGRLFGDHLSFTTDFFNDQRNGIFRQRQQIPDYVGVVNMPFGNVGKMRSYGSDGNIAYTQDISKDISFTIRGNYTYSKNIIQHIEQANPKYPYQSADNMPYGYISGYVALGLFNDQDDIQNSPIQTFGSYMPGDIKYKDVNGDGKIDSDDQVPLSYNTYPLVMYGFGGEFKYKNLTLGVLFKGTGKTDYFHVGQAVQRGSVWEGNGMGYFPFYGGETGNILDIVADPSNRWIPKEYAEAHGIDPALAENPNAKFPRLQYGNNNNNTQLSTWWKSDARYLRLQEITLNYNLKKDFLKKAGLSSIDLQLVGSNLFVWDKVGIFDPEQAHLNGRAYPIPARYTLQVYLNF